MQFLTEGWIQQLSLSEGKKIINFKADNWKLSSLNVEHCVVVCKYYKTLQQGQLNKPF